MVAMNVWPTDGADGSVASEARWRKMGRVWAPSGVIGGAGGELAPSLAFPNLTVQSGAAWVDGHYTELAGSQVLTATANGLAVVRFDPAANTADLLWRDAVSVPAQSPTGTWELPIAKTVGSALSDQRLIFQAQQAINNGVARFTNSAQRTAQLPAPVLNQVSMRDDLAGIIETWNGTLWRPLSGASVRGYGALADASRTTNGTFDALNVVIGSFPYPVTMVATIGIQAGFGSALQSFSWDLYLLNTGGFSPSWGPYQAVAGIFASVGMPYSWNVAVGQDPSFRVRLTPTTASAGNVFHTGGTVHWWAYAA